MALTAKKVYAILKRQISDMESQLNHPVRYKGTVATADLLPLNPAIGDMYNIEQKSIYGEAGMNVSWNGVVWDTMGAPIDMSLYIKSDELADWVKQPQKPSYTAEEVGALPADSKIPTKVSELENDSNYLSGTDETLSVSGKAADAKSTGAAVDSLKKSIEDLREKRIEKTADDTSVVLDASTFYVFPEMQTLSVTGLNGHFRFTSGSMATTLTLPDSVTSDLAVEPNRIYEVSIVDGYLAWTSWAVS